MGPFNNDTGLYLYDEGFDNGLWLIESTEHSARYTGLIIIPLDNDEIEGCTDPVLENALLKACKKSDNGFPSAEDIDRLGLQIVPQSLHRWNEFDGFYSA